MRDQSFSDGLAFGFTDSPQAHSESVHVLPSFVDGTFTIEFWADGKTESKTVPLWHYRSFDYWMLDLQRAKFICQETRLKAVAEIDQLAGKIDLHYQRMADQKTAAGLFLWLAIAFGVFVVISFAVVTYLGK